jgi:hypothetical protein
MHALRLRQAGPQSPVCLADGAVRTPPRILHERALRYSCAGQRFQDGWHLALRDALAIVQGVARRQDARSQPMRRRPILVRCQVRMAPPYGPATGLTAANRHLILPHHRPRSCGHVGDRRGLHPVFDQDPAAVRACHLRHRHGNRRRPQGLHRWRNAIRERSLARLAAWPLGAGRQRLPAERRRLSVLAAPESLQFGAQVRVLPHQLGIQPFQCLDAPQQFPRLQRLNLGRLAQALAAARIVSVDHNASLRVRWPRHTTFHNKPPTPSENASRLTLEDRLETANQIRSHRR